MTVKLQARDLVKRYGDLVAVNGISLEVKAGEIFGLLGPNGAGKTTTLEMLEGLRRPDGGSCELCGLDPRTQAAAVRGKIGIQFQQTSLPPDATVLELLMLYRSFYKDPVPVAELLHQFQLTEKAKALVGKLSGGQRQRLALALALVGRPEVIFLDEPTTGLDPQSRRSLWAVIQALRNEGRAVILTTHYMEEAEVLCDRLAIMDRGTILATGTPRALIAAHGPEMAIEFAAPVDRIDPAALARLTAVTGVKVSDGQVALCTANAAKTLVDLATYIQGVGLDLNDLRTRNASLEDVFLTLTGRRLRDA
jgi:ABC-2 type transport system ATP-binding protein